MVRVGNMNPSAVKTPDLLIIGSPTQAGRPLKAIVDLLAAMPESVVKGTKVAAFDTRVPSKIAVIFGYAAPKIASSLEKRGGKLVKPAEGFFVKSSKGPLKEGELERAASWAKTVQNSLASTKSQ